MKKKSTFSWLLEFAGRRIKYFGWSVVLAWHTLEDALNQQPD